MTTSPEAALARLVDANPVPSSEGLDPTDREVSQAVAAIVGPLDQSASITYSEVLGSTRLPLRDGRDGGPRSRASVVTWIAIPAAVVIGLIVFIAARSSHDGVTVTDTPTPTAAATPDVVDDPLTLRPTELDAAADAYGAWLTGAGGAASASELAWEYEFESIQCDQAPDVAPAVATCAAAGVTDALTRELTEAWTYTTLGTISFSAGGVPTSQPTDHVVVDDHETVRADYLAFLDENGPAAWEISGCRTDATPAACVRLLKNPDRITNWLATDPPLPWVLVVPPSVDGAQIAADHVIAFLEGSDPYPANAWAMEVGEISCDLLDNDDGVERYRCTNQQTDAMSRTVSPDWVTAKKMLSAETSR